MPTSSATAIHLLLTERGESWLNNFDEADRPVARELAGALTLISHNEFERGLTRLILKVAEGVVGAIALYGARELPEGLHLESSEVSSSTRIVDATPRGSDIGSEGRIASIIRGLCRSHHGKLLNHPALPELKARRVDVVLILDDFVGSGKRCTDFLDAFWMYPTVKSWVSYKSMRFAVVAYAATAGGTRKVKAHAAAPSVHIFRHCPTLRGLPWERSRIDRAMRLCNVYTNRQKFGANSLGFKSTGALLVFEHSCPNNVPAIFWAKSKSNTGWQPLFPKKTVDTSVASAFPTELARRDPVHALIAAGLRRIGDKMECVMERPLPADMIVALSLIARGRRRVESVADATGHTAADAEKLLERCIAAGFVSPRYRITDAGRTELNGLQTSHASGAASKPECVNDFASPLNK